MKFKKGDTIKVTAGKDNGKTGTIVRVIPALNQVVVDGINLYKKHVRPQGNEKGGLVDLPRPLYTAKIQLVCPNCKTVTRIGFTGEGKDKVRVCRKCGKPIIKTEEPKKASKKK